MAGRENFKIMKVGLSADSLAWQDLLEYGRELSMQPAETARVILVEWSQARHGHLALGGGVPHFTPSPVHGESSKPKELNAEHERAKARGARFASTVNLDDD
jgi:hypothetical protein